jgi:hypothetical protein
MSRRVLIVSPHFPPINAPDHQRVRMSLPYFEEFGWRATVLAVEPEYVEGIWDSGLLQSVPANADVIRTRALPAKRSRRLGLGSLALRALPFLRAAGDRLLKEDEFDLAYFSTTMFPTMALGPYWRRKWHVPYVLDFQDPWLSDYYDSPGAPAPPGGKLKYGLTKSLARLLEPKAMRQVSHVISVSPAYPKTLLARYSWMREDQFTVLPFGASQEDFKKVSEAGVTQSIFDPNDGKRHWVYVGRGGGDMEKALRLMFLAIKRGRELEPERYEQLRLHFIGTNYALAGQAVKLVEPIAAEYGLNDILEERTGRVSYFEAIKILTDSDAILLFGSDDAGYTASKLYPCILAQKPILAIFHEESSVVDILRRCNAGRAITFSANDVVQDKIEIAAKNLDWVLTLPKGFQPEINWENFRPYTALEMTRRQCEVFEKALGET